MKGGKWQNTLRFACWHGSREARSNFAKSDFARRIFMQRVMPAVFCLSKKRSKRFLWRSILKLVGTLVSFLRLLSKIIDFFEKYKDMLG